MIRVYKYINQIITYVLPPERWRVPVIIAFGILFGLAGFIIHIAKATSYLSDDPKVCMNCHIMAPEYANWQHSSHRERAGCNDCHVPHTSVFAKYFFKARDGMYHSYVFTLRNEPQAIIMHEAGQHVVQQNCMRCHEHQIEKTHLNLLYKSEEPRHCWECHREVPHGRVKSLSSVPNARVPTTPPIMPDWLNKYMKNKNRGDSK